jgi:hypothetical protein
MSKTEILQELAKLTPEERQEVRLRLAELDGEDWPDEGVLTDLEKASLRSASAKWRPTRRPSSSTTKATQKWKALLGGPLLPNGLRLPRKIEPLRDFQSEASGLAANHILAVAKRFRCCPNRRPVRGLGLGLNMGL